MIKYLGKNTRWCNNNINKIYTWYNLNLCVILIHKHAILIYMLPVNICIICFYSSSWKVRIIGRIILLYFNYVIQTSVSCNCKLEISLSVFISWNLKKKLHIFFFSSSFFFFFNPSLRNCYLHSSWINKNGVLYLLSPPLYENQVQFMQHRVPGKFQIVYISYASYRFRNKWKLFTSRIANS